MSRSNGTRTYWLVILMRGLITDYSALYRDSCLYVVPGSHKISRTPEQRVHSETLDAPVDPLLMPGSIQLTLQRGFFSFDHSELRIHVSIVSFSWRNGLLQFQHSALRSI